MADAFGEFTIPDPSNNPSNAVTGLGFTPTFVMLQTAGNTATGGEASISDGFSLSVGCYDGTSSACMSFVDEDSDADGNSSVMRSSTNTLVWWDAAFYVGDAGWLDVTSLDADGFSWTAGGDADASHAVLITYWATDRDDIAFKYYEQNADVASTSDGAFSLTGVGFQPEAVVAYTVQPGTVDTAGNWVTTHAEFEYQANPTNEKTFSIGAATGSAAGDHVGVTMLNSSLGTTSTVAATAHYTGALAHLNDAGAVFGNVNDDDRYFYLESFDSDGATLSYRRNATGGGAILKCDPAHLLVFFGSSDVALQTGVGAASGSANTTISPGFEPELVFALGANGAVNAASYSGTTANHASWANWNSYSASISWGIASPAASINGTWASQDNVGWAETWGRVNSNTVSSGAVRALPTWSTGYASYVTLPGGDLESWTTSAVTYNPSSGTSGAANSTAWASFLVIGPGNSPPDAPTITAPTDESVVDLSGNLTVSWTYNDPEGDAQGSWQIQRAVWDETNGVYAATEYWNDGGSTWQGTTIWNSGAGTSHTVSGFTNADDTVKLTVLVRDSKAATSPASAVTVNPYEYWNGTAWVVSATPIYNTSATEDVTPTVPFTTGTWKWSVSTKDAAGDQGTWATDFEFTVGVFERWGMLSI